MTQHATEHGAHDEGHSVHLPDPSLWPIVAGAAALLAGFALVWWSRDRDSHFAGPLLGAAILGLLIASAGWAYEDGRMKRKAEEGTTTTPRNARFTQVVTFAIAEGQLLAARSMAGVLQAIESSDLRDLQGFQDMRITISPADSGPSQVLVETTWNDREGLAAYEESQQTILDILAAHPEEVMAGTVQVFDMDVVRDTKDTSFKFGLGAAATVLVALIAGGFALGAGLTAFESEATATGSEGTGTPSGPAPGTITATDNKFDQTSITVPPNTQVTITFQNKGSAKHNIHFLTAKGGDTLADGAKGAILDGGKSEQLSFTTPGAGTYYFQCDVHPDQMSGQLNVVEGAPAPGAPAANGGGGGAAGGGAQTITAQNVKFSTNQLQGTTGQEFSITLDNKDTAPHNIHFLDKKGGADLAPGAKGAILQAGKSETVKFTPPSPGTFYFQCDVHPDQMNGTFTVK